MAYLSVNMFLYSLQCCSCYSKNYWGYGDQYTCDDDRI